MKHKIGDLVEFVDAPRPRLRLRPRLHRHLRLRLRPPLHLRLDKTLGLILKIYDKFELYDKEPPKGYDPPDDRFNGYLWLSCFDGNVYLFFEYETKEL